MAGKRNLEKCAARGGMTRAKVVEAVFERDNHCCTKCGMTNDSHRELTGKSLEVHRVIPGGMYRVESCVLLCRSCHGPEAKRGAGVPDEEGNGSFMVRLPEAYREKLQQLKDKTDKPFAAMIRRALEAYLEKADQ